MNRAQLIVTLFPDQMIVITVGTPSEAEMKIFLKNISLCCWVCGRGFKKCQFWFQFLSDAVAGVCCLLSIILIKQELMKV